MAPNLAFTVFAAIGLIGFLFLLLSLVIGELFDHGADLGHGGFEHGGPGFLSSRVLSVLVTAFGGTGAIATQMGAGTMVSSIIGAVVGLTLILLKKQEWSSRLPYGPYIALAATIWVFGGNHFFEWLLRHPI